MNPIRRALIWSCFGAVVLLAVAFFVYPHLPAQIPVHWNMLGQVDGYAPRQLSFLFAVLPFVVPISILLLSRLDKRVYHKGQNDKTLAVIVLLMAALMAFLYIIIVIAALQPNSENVPRFLLAAIGLMFVISGNIMPRLRQNSTVGIRLPWTLVDERSWRYTHRLGGLVFVITGIVALLCLFLPLPLSFIVFFSVLMVGIALTSVLSYRRFRAYTHESAGTASPVAPAEMPINAEHGDSDSEA
ncbi:MAG: SdpI family protein [Bacteroidales bacterium]|nr:SdpI family protein [Bacteroidales bacterium]